MKPKRSGKKEKEKDIKGNFVSFAEVEMSEGSKMRGRRKMGQSLTQTFFSVQLKSCFL